LLSLSTLPLAPKACGIIGLFKQTGDAAPEIYEALPAQAQEPGYC